MNIWGNSRKLYAMAAAMVVTAVVLLTLGSAWGKPAGRAADSGAVLPTAVPAATLPAATPETGLSAAVDTKTMPTVVYYQDDSGYLVPVMRSVPQQQGVAAATLSLMVKNERNDMDAARLGLRTVLPEGCGFEIDISPGGTARIDLTEEALHMASADAEQNMICAVVQALTEFETVQNVEFLFSGQKRDALPNGTNVSGQFTRGSLNPEMGEIAGAKNAVQLYFPCASGSVIVPVTRQVFGNADLQTAVLELAKGPAATGTLEGALPAGCGVISAEVADGVAKINFTSEFIRLAEESDGGRMALKALVLTCTQFEGVEKVEIYVEGEKYDPGAATLAIPTFMNVADDIVSTYIQSQTALIFDFE